MNQYKKINLSIFLVSLFVLIATLIYWHFICSSGNCSYDLRNSLLRPLTQAGVFLGAISLVFLFLPVHYFQAWFKRIFSWAFPLSVIIVFAIQDTPSFSFSFPRTLVVQMLGMFFGVVSLLFVFSHYIKSTNQTKNKME